MSSEIYATLQTGILDYGKYVVLNIVINVSDKTIFSNLSHVDVMQFSAAGN